MVIKDTPAEVYCNCREYYLSEEVTALVHELAEDALRHAAEIELLRYGAVSVSGFFKMGQPMERGTPEKRRSASTLSLAFSEMTPLAQCGLSLHAAFTPKSTPSWKPTAMACTTRPKRSTCPDSKAARA